MDATLSSQSTAPAFPSAMLRTVLTALTAAHPGSAVRLDRAAQLVAAGAVSPVYGIGHLVASQSEPGRAYWVQRMNDVLTCECEDFRRLGGPCKHGWAVIIYQACERLDAERNDPTANMVPFPDPAYDPDADRFELTPRGLAYLTDTEYGPA